MLKDRIDCRATGERADRVRGVGCRFQRRPPASILRSLAPRQIAWPVLVRPAGGNQQACGIRHVGETRKRQRSWCKEGG